MTPLPEDETLRERVVAQRPIRIEGSFFRLVSERYRAVIISSGGSFQHGGRYNPKRGFGVLYLYGERADQPGGGASRRR